MTLSQIILSSMRDEPFPTHHQNRRTDRKKQASFKSGRYTCPSHHLLQGGTMALRQQRMHTHVHIIRFFVSFFDFSFTSFAIMSQLLFFDLFCAKWDFFYRKNKQIIKTNNNNNIYNNKMSQRTTTSTESLKFRQIKHPHFDRELERLRMKSIDVCVCLSGYLSHCMHIISHIHSYKRWLPFPAEIVICIN